MNAYAILSGGVVGVAFGAALQRGRFCINTGFRDVLLIRDATMVRAWALAVAIQMASVAALNAAGWLPLSVPPLWWEANIAGGLLFGAGMVLAGGCSSGTCYRVGEGMAGSILALLGFGAGILLTSRGALTPLESWLRSGTTTLDGAAPTLANVLGVDALWVSLAIASAIGLALGGIGVAAWLASTATGRNYGLSMTGPLRTWFNAAFSSGTVLDWGSVLLAGLIAGSFLSAWWHRELRWRVPQGPRLLQSGAGGIVMGVGAQIAGGCNIGHSLTGLSVLSLGSALTTACIVLGAWFMAYLLFVRPARMAAAAE